MIYLKSYKLFESSGVTKSELIGKLIELSTELYNYVQEYNSATKMGHNLHFTYDTTIETIQILTLIGFDGCDRYGGTYLTEESPDGLIRAICNELVKMKGFFVKRSYVNNDMINNREPEYNQQGVRQYSQKRMYLKYYDFGNTIENLIKNSKWDIPNQSKMEREDLVFIEDSLVSDFDDSVDLEKLDVDAVPGKDGCFIRVPITSSKLDYNTDFIRRLDSYFGGLIILRSYRDDGKLYLPFWSPSANFWDFYSK